ncbi:MAG: potassium channel family protein [Myxococcota bacterium]|nr:potassium channel family protein [Myxococcota bacterium]
MSAQGGTEGGPHDEGHRFWLLLTALAALLVGYPYFGDTRPGTFAGGATALLVLTGAVYAVRTRRWTFAIAVVLAVATAAASIRAFVGGIRGDPLVEATFCAFYAFTSVAVFLEVIQSRDVTADTLTGAVCVYLLIGLTFANVYDLLETLEPGSFQINVDTARPVPVGWRTLVFFSFMTLTTIGLGDVTPTTAQAQSLAAIEGVMGVLFVAVLVAKVVAIYVRRSAEDPPSGSG